MKPDWLLTGISYIIFLNRAAISTFLAGLNWDSPDDCRFTVNIRTFPAFLQDRREVWDDYQYLGSPKVVGGLSGHFPRHLGALLPSIACERMAIERLTLALVVAAAVVPQSATKSLGTSAVDGYVPASCPGRNPKLGVGAALPVRAISRCASQALADNPRSEPKVPRFLVAQSNANSMETSPREAAENKETADESSAKPKKPDQREAAKETAKFKAQLEKLTKLFEKLETPPAPPSFLPPVPRP
ncbi:MAG: hypothetical protein ABSD08_13405 [Xanthobacteraceae bacterium]